MNVNSVGQSILYSLTSASGMLQSSSVSQDYEQIQSAAELIAQDDADSDGVLTLEETALSQDMFNTADSDSDGYLTREELEAYMAAGPGQAPPAMDAASIMESDDEDGDGLLSIEETPLTEEMFATADSDGDGFISEDELEAYLASAPEGGAAAGGPPPGGMAEEDDEEEDDLTSITSFAISAYEKANANFLSLLAGDADSSGDSIFSSLVV